MALHGIMFGCDLRKDELLITYEQMGFVRGSCKWTIGVTFSALFKPNFSDFGMNVCKQMRTNSLWKSVL
jgi:hypothetical protein